MIRPFQPDDAEQLTALVNAHVAAVVPGILVTADTVTSRLEREPEEAIVDPWVVRRHTLVAAERDGVVAGTHLLGYGDDESVGESYRGHAEIHWLVCRHDRGDVGAQLVAAALETMRAWQPRRLGADGALPAPFVYGVPDVWPHVRALYADAGFVPGRVEIVLVADVAELPRAPELPLELRRSLGTWTRLSAIRDGAQLGYVEVDTDVAPGWADVANLVVADDEVRAWLLAQAADWLRLGGFERLVAYAEPDDDELALYAQAGFRELVRTERGWLRAP